MILSKVEKVSTAIALAVALVLAFQGKGSFSTRWLIALSPWIVSGLLSQVSRRRALARCQQFAVEFFRRKNSWLNVTAVLFLPAFCFFSLNGKTGLTSYDNLGVNLTAVSLLHYGTADLSQYLKRRRVEPESVHRQYPYSVTATARGYFSSYPNGEAFFSVPFFFLAKIFGADLQNENVQWKLAKFLASILAAVTIVLFYFVALALAQPKTALFMSVLLMVGSVMSTTISHGLWSQSGVLFWMMLALFCQARKTPAHAAYWAMAQGGCFAMMFVCRLPSALIFFPLGFWMSWNKKQEILSTGFGFLSGFFPWAVFHYWAYQNIFGPQLNQSQGFSELKYFGGNLAGILISPARGLLVYQTWLWTIPVAVLLLRGKAVATPPGDLSSKNPHFCGWQLVFTAAICFHVLLVGAWSAWTGGHCWGSRLLSEIVPLLALLLLPLADRLVRSNYLTPVFCVLIFTSFFPHAGAMFGNSDAWDNRPANKETSYEQRLWDWREPPFLYPYYFAPEGFQLLKRSP